MKRLLLIACAAIALLAFMVEGAFAQGDTLTLRQAIVLARGANLRIRASEFDVKQSASRVSELKATRLPPVLFHSHFLHAPETGYSEVVTNAGEYGVQLSSSLLLYDGGAKSAMIDQSMQSVERSTLNVRRSEAEVTYDVRVSYYDILRAQEELRIRDENVARLEDYRALLERLRLAGGATASDVLKAEVDLNNSKIARDRSTRSVEKSRLTLAQAIGVEMRQWIEVTEGTEDDSLALLGAAVEHNYDLQMAESEKAASLYDLEIVKAERMPALSLTGDVGALGVHPSEFDQNVGYSVYLTLDLPLFNWGASSDRIEQKEILRDQIEAQARLRRREIETEWKIAMNDLDAARNALAGYAENNLRAEQQYLAAKTRFAGGAGSNLEVLDSQRLLTETQLSYSDALFQLRASRAILLKLGGGERSDLLKLGGEIK